jgi:hypothetical protein
VPTINGQEYQHGLISSQFAGADGGDTFETTKFSELNYEDGAEKKPTHDAKGKIDGFTVDNQKTDGSLTVRLSEYFRMRDWALRNNPGKGMGQIMLDWTVTYGNSPTKRRTDRIVVMFQKEAKKSQSNQEALEVQLPLFVYSVEDADTGATFINYDD